MRRKFTPNQYYLDGDTAELVITDQTGATVGHAIIDRDDLGRVLARGRWSLNGYGYAISSDRMLLHRMLIDVPDGMQVDHRNHNRLDCRKANLRICTTAENSRNKSGARSESRTGIRNVSWVEERGKWRVKVKANGKERHIGYYKTQDAAVAAARRARIEMHGDFAS